MKRICAIILTLLLLGMAFPFTETITGPVGIATRSDLMRIADDPSGSYVLTADIDLGDAPWTPIPFSGTFDGAGHTIANLYVTQVGADSVTTYDGNRKEYDTVFAGLFSVVTDAEIKNLRILNAKIEIETDRNCFTGTIAGYAANTVISDCAVTTRSTLAITSTNAGLGGIVGFNLCTVITGCAAEAELLFIDRNPDVLCEEFLGGIYASGCGTVGDCTVLLRGYADIYGYAHNGGVVGMYKRVRGYTGKVQTVHGTSVDAEIRFFEVTPSKRAYCKPIIGEDSAGECHVTRNQMLHFDYTYEREAKPMRPESCETPAYTAAVTEPTCSEWGYTTYTCSACGYSYRDDYVLPQHRYQEEITEPASCTKEGKAVFTCVYCGDSYSAAIPLMEHTPGEWIETTAPQIGVEGEETQSCNVCGAVLGTRTVPAIDASPEPVATMVQRVLVEESVIELFTDDTADLHITIEPSDAENSTVIFESSDPSVVRVDDTGRIRALYPGTATIRIYSADGGAETTCSVLVTAKPEQEETHSLFSWMRCG